MLNKKYYIFISIFLFLICFSCSFADDKNLIGIFNEGNKYYNEGEYKKALESYQKILSEKTSPEVLYNAGCSAFKEGKIGLSLVYLQHAFEIIPRDYEVRKLRNEVKNKISDSGGVLMRPLESPVLSYFTKNEYAISFFILFFLLFALILLNKKLKKDLFWVYFSLSSCLVIISICFIIYMIRFSGNYVAVTSPTAEVREIQKIEEPSFYILKDGSEVKLISLENGWAKIGFDGRDGRYFEGWVPEKDITKI